MDLVFGVLVFLAQRRNVFNETNNDLFLFDISVLWRCLMISIVEKPGAKEVTALEFAR